MQPRQLVLELGSNDDTDDESAADGGDDHAAISQAGTGSPRGPGAAGKSQTSAGRDAAGRHAACKQVEGAEEEEVSQYRRLSSSSPAAVHNTTWGSALQCTAKQAAPVPAAAGSAHDPIHLSTSASEASSPGTSRSEGSSSGYGDGDRDGHDTQGRRMGTAGAKPVAKTPRLHPFPGLGVPGPGRVSGGQPGGTGKTPLRGLMGLRERLQQLSMGSNAAATPAMPATGGGSTSG
jgi:hypothetical protein